MFGASIIHKGHARAFSSRAMSASHNEIIQFLSEIMSNHSAVPFA